MNEKELIRQFKKGSQKAFDEIYHMYSARLYAYCMQYTKSQEDTEEIVQDVFTKLWMSRKNIIQEETLRSYIFKIAKNQLINVYKSRINSFVFEKYVNYYNEVKCSVNNTHHAVEYDDFRHLLEIAMKKLSKTQRNVIECSKLKQLSNKETAEKLKLKEQTVKNQLSIGLKVLQKELQKYLIWVVIINNIINC